MTDRFSSSPKNPMDDFSNKMDSAFAKYTLFDTSLNIFFPWNQEFGSIYIFLDSLKLKVLVSVNSKWGRLLSGLLICDYVSDLIKLEGEES